MSNYLKSFFYGILFYFLTIIVYLLYSLYQFTSARSMGRLFLGGFLIGLPIFVLMMFLSYKVFKSEREDLKWKTPLKNISLLLIMAIVLGIILNGLMMLNCKIRGCSGEAGMGFLIVNGLIIFYFIALSVLSAIFSWIYYFLSEKNSLIVLISLIVLGLIIWISIFAFNDFCLKADENCYAKKAIAINDPDLCEKTWISSSCYQKYALEKNDESICELITDYNYEKDSCYVSFAVKRNDATLCRLVVDNYHRKNCCEMRFQVGYAGFPGKLSNEQKETCGINT